MTSIESLEKNFTLYCPFPSAVNQYADAVEQHTISWIRDFNLVPSEAAYQKMLEQKYFMYAARTYPEASLEGLKIISDFLFLLFILDELSEKLARDKKSEDLVHIYNKLIDILQGAAHNKYDVPLVLAFQNIRERLLLYATDTWMNCLVKDIKECFESLIWESQNFEHAIMPPISKYIKMRPFTSSIYILFNLIEIEYEKNLPPFVHNNSSIKTLKLLTNNFISWSNDIISYEKEIHQGDIHNLVILLQHHYQLSLEEALLRSVSMCNSQLRAFIDLKSRLPSFGQSIDVHVKSYISGLCSWMRGNLDWSINSKRYQPQIKIIISSTFD